MFFKILDRYIGRIIFNNVIMNLFILISLSSVIKFIEQLRKVGQGNYSILGAGLFTLINIPRDVEVFFPMSVLLGVLLGLGSLTSTNELIVMQASGFSHAKIINAAIKTTILITIITMVINNWIAPKGEQIAYNYRTKMIYKGSILSVHNGLWVKDKKDFIFINKVINNNKLLGISIYQFNKNNKLQSMRYIARADFNNNNWKLSNINEIYLSNYKQITSKKIINSEWKTNLTPDKLKSIILEPNTLSILKLYNYIKYLKTNEQEYKKYQIYMWNKISSPFSIIIMTLIASSFILGPLKNFHAKALVITGISLSFLFYILNQTIGPIILLYKIPFLLGILLPNISFFIISIIMLSKQKYILIFLKIFFKFKLIKNKK